LPSALQNTLRKKEAERHKEAAEEALQQREAQYRLITENTRDLICLLDAQNKFLYASPSFDLVLGYKPDDLIDTDYFQLIHPDDAPQETGANVRVSSESGSARGRGVALARDFLRARAGRQLDDEARAARVGALDPSAATMPRNEVAHDREADPRPHPGVSLAR
jgi:PAS domain S-box-containing protein